MLVYQDPLEYLTVVELDVKMNSSHSHLRLGFLWRSIYRGIFCLCILFAIWTLLTRGEQKPFKFPSGFIQAISNKVGHETIEQNWSMQLVTSTIRRLLRDDLQHYIVVGLLNEDGTLGSEFISSQKFVDQDEWEVEVYDTEEVFEKSMAQRFQKKPDDAVKIVHFEICPPKMKNYIPCLDDVAAIKQLPDATKGEKWERHCPNRATRTCCIIATPGKYRMPIRWPSSKDEVWMSNIPRPRRGWNESWISTQKDKLRFPTASIPFPEGMEGYLDQLAQMVPNLQFGVRTRSALDFGGGVASFGAALMGRGVLPLSIAAKGSPKNEVQLALERGIPAMVAALASQRLLFPSQAFDLIHCSDCEVDWTSDEGILLLESNRLLRAGGYFAWAAPPEVTLRKRYKTTWHEMEDLGKKLCWTLVAKEGHLAIWQKPYDNSCYHNRAPGTVPGLCDETDDPDAVWYVPLQQCISLLPTNISNGNLSDWPARLSLLPERLGVSPTNVEIARRDVFVAQERHWNEIVSGYLRGLGLKKEQVRNVMDMRAGYGGFAAALVDQHVDWWVMNVVPPHGPNSLTVIYDRGLLGVVHDWCEPFDTYPRTYDLLHAVGLFSADESRCNIAHIILEMDRILRPGGWVLIRENKAMAQKVEALAKSVHWKTRILETESGPYGKDKLLSCIKRRR